MTTAYSPIVTTHGEVLHAGFSERPLAAGDLLLADVGAETRAGFAGDVTRVWPVSGRFSTTQSELYAVVLAAQAAAIAAVRPGVRFLDVHRAAGLALCEGLVQLGILRGAPLELLQRGILGPFFPHGVGHLLGLDVHDLEDLGDRAGYAPGRSRPTGLGDRYLRLDRDLVPGMCVTIEPGYYRIPALIESELSADDRKCINHRALAHFGDVRGIRIEDDVLVTDTGAEVLTANIPKAIAHIELPE
jgi:Xaa-Pro aminopeptidase